MDQWHLAGIGTRLVTFLQDLQAAAENIFAHLPEGYRSFADFDKFIRAVKCLAAGLRLVGEKFGKADRYTVENALQRADGRVGGVDLIREIVELVTPARLASSRWEIL